LFYYKGFLDSLNKKLNNERFCYKMQNPKVINLEKKRKKMDTEEER